MALFSLNGRDVAEQEYEGCFPPTASACFTSFRGHVARGMVRVLRWAWHSKRLEQDCLFLDFACPNFEQVWHLVGTLSAKLELDQEKEDLRVRVDVMSGFCGVRVSKIPRLAEGPQPISLASVQNLRSSPTHKTFEAARVSLSAMLQVQPGADEALLISCNGDVHEGAWSNFGWIAEDSEVMVTPFGLDGITQRILPELVSSDAGFRFGGAERINIFDSRFASISPFVMSSVRGIVPVARIDGVNFAPSAQILRLAEAYRRALYTS